MILFQIDLKKKYNFFEIKKTKQTNKQTKQNKTKASRSVQFYTFKFPMEYTCKVRNDNYGVLSKTKSDSYKCNYMYVLKNRTHYSIDDLSGEYTT